MKRKMNLLVLMVMLMVVLAGCSSSGGSEGANVDSASSDTEMVVKDAESSESDTELTEGDTDSPEDEQVEYIQKEYKGISFEYNSQFDFEDKDDSYYISDGTGIFNIILSSIDKNDDENMTESNLEYLISLFEEPENIKEFDVDIVETTAKCATLTGKSGDIITDVKILVFVDDNFCYLLSYFVQSDGSGENYDKYINEFDLMIESVQFIENNEPIEVPEDSTQEETQEPESEITTGQENALAKAEEYLSIMAFSHKGLIEQLEYEGFSNEEAIYGTDNCGADWNEQAAVKARDYLDLMAFSRSGLIEQLEYDGFTNEQAAYGATENGY